VSLLINPQTMQRAVFFTIKMAFSVEKIKRVFVL